MTEKPNNFERPEDDEDKYLEDFEHTHRFQHLMSNDIFNEIVYGDGMLSQYAENVMQIWGYAKDNNLSVDEAAAQLDVDHEDPTHQVYIRVACNLDVFYNS